MNPKLDSCPVAVVSTQREGFCAARTCPCLQDIPYFTAAQKWALRHARCANAYIFAVIVAVATDHIFIGEASGDAGSNGDMVVGIVAGWPAADWIAAGKTAGKCRHCCYAPGSRNVECIARTVRTDTMPVDINPGGPGVVGKTAPVFCPSCGRRPGRCADLVVEDANQNITINGPAGLVDGQVSAACVTCGRARSVSYCHDILMGMAT